MILKFCNIKFFIYITVSLWKCRCHRSSILKSIINLTACWVEYFFNILIEKLCSFINNILLIFTRWSINKWFSKFHGKFCNFSLTLKDFKLILTIWRLWKVKIFVNLNRQNLMFFQVLSNFLTFFKNQNFLLLSLF